MMISFPFLSTPIDFEMSSAQILVIENTVLYRNTIVNFFNKDIDESIVFSEEYKPFNFSNNVAFIENPLQPEILEKKIKTNIDKDIEKFINDRYYNDLSNCFLSLNTLGINLCNDYDYNFKFNSEITTDLIVKLLNFTINIDETVTSLEKLLTFLRLYKKYTGIKCFVIANLSLYFTLQEIKSLFETLNTERIYLLDIEKNQLYGTKYSITRIIDKDMFEIIDK